MDRTPKTKKSCFFTDSKGLNLFTSGSRKLSVRVGRFLKHKVVKARAPGNSAHHCAHLKVNEESSQNICLFIFFVRVLVLFRWRLFLPSVGPELVTLSVSSAVDDAQGDGRGI